MTRVLTTSAGVPSVAAVRPENALKYKKMQYTHMVQKTINTNVTNDPTVIKQYSTDHNNFIYTTVI